MVRRKDEVKYFLTVMFDGNPPFCFKCLPNDPIAVKSGLVTTDHKWLAPNLTDPRRIDAFDIGDYREVGNSCKKTAVVLVFDRRLKAHRDKAEYVMLELSKSCIRQYGT